jgi:hypothetical protein
MVLRDSLLTLQKKRSGQNFPLTQLQLRRGLPLLPMLWGKWHSIHLPEVLSKAIRLELPEPLLIQLRQENGLLSPEKHLLVLSGIFIHPER